MIRNAKSRIGHLVLGVFFCLAGECTAAKIQLWEGKSRYLADWEGNPLFLVGYHAHNVDLEDSIGYQRLLELNARNRINYVRFFPACEGLGARERGGQWVMFQKVAPQKVDLGEWEDAYWPRVRKYLAFMYDHGIVAHVSIFEGCLPWDGHPFNAKFNVNADMGNVDRDGDGNGHEQGEFFDYGALTDRDATAERKRLKYYQERMVGRLLAETSSFPNVMYEIGNELPNPGIDWVRYWVRFIRERCDNLITYNGIEGLREAGFSGATEHVHREENVRTPFAEKEMASGRFVASSSDGAEITNIGSDGGRRCLWRAFTAGIGGWLNYSIDFYNTNAENYYYSPESPGRYNFRKALYYYNAISFIHDWGLPFPKMSPRDEVILGKPDGMDAHCLAGNGEYVLHLCGETVHGRVKLNLEPASQHGYWFNPRTGAFFNHVTVKSGANDLSVPAGNQDVVLYVGRPRTELKGFYTQNVTTPSPTVQLTARNVGEKLAKDSVHAEYSTDGCESFRLWDRVVIEEHAGGSELAVMLSNIPFGEARAARNWIRIAVATVSGRRATCTMPMVGTDAAWVELGKQNVGDGLYHVQNNDGRTVSALEAGCPCRRNADPSETVPDRYMYFSVDNAFAFGGGPNDYLLGVTYLDSPDGFLELQYDAEGKDLRSIYRSGGVVHFGGTNTWLQHTFALHDAYFADRQNAGADFRFFLGKDKVAYVSRVQLRVTKETDVRP